MSRVIDPFDELAQLFLTDADEPLHAQHGKEPDIVDDDVAPVELLLVGHLPVRADLWLRPYAEAIARRVGAAALVRLDSDEPSVELLGGDGNAIDDDAERSLRSMLQRISPSVDLWIVRPNGQTPAEAIVEAGATRITIISSADEAALVAAYQRIKEIADAANEIDSDLPALGIAILGSADAVARSMVDRLNRTTRTFLGLELPLVATLQQMEAGSRSKAYARFLGERSPSVEDVVAWLNDMPREAASEEPVEAAAPMPTMQPALSMPSPVVIDDSEPEFDDEPENDVFEDDVAEAVEAYVAEQPAPAAQADEPEEKLPGDRDVLQMLRFARHEEPAPRVERPAAARRDDVAEAPRVKTWRAGESVKMAPKPAIMREPKSPEQIKEPGTIAVQHLASFVEGLTPVAVRCPGHERIELALDPAGRFHLLCKEDAMREIHLVEAWTKSHRELLAMALSNAAVDAGAAAVAHVFTEKPVTVADLHGSTLHLHVLAPVVVEGKQGWYAAPLNLPAQ